MSVVLLALCARARGASSIAVVASAALLAACSSVPLGGPSASTARPAAKCINNAPVLPPPNTGRGGYYQDDGPGENIPDCLADTPDAVPRIEPLHTRANRPYAVFGKTYTPITDDRPFKQRGIASWYGRKYHGQKTSSGEVYDMFQMTAAHPTLPIPSYVRVTHIASGRQVVLRVNDRGPFHSDRIIDLSYTAALKLGYLGRGSSEIELERILPDEILAMQGGGSPVATKKEDAVRTPAAASGAASGPASGPASAPASAGAWWVQLGAYSQQANAEQARQRLSGVNGISALEVVPANGIFRLHGGPFASRAEAEAAAQALRASGNGSALIVQR